MKSTRAAVCVLFLLLAAGCGASAEKRLIGKWRYDPVEAANPSLAEKAGKPAASAIAGALGGFNLQLVAEFKPDHTMMMNTTMLGRSLPSPAIPWKVIEEKGDTVVIETTDPHDEKLNRIELTLVGDDRLEFKSPKDGKTMTFTRVKESP